ncbi:2-dehydro-3-deoxy-6-phosphogalactonate aldolase [Hyphomonas sp. FCG-A18]|uniref:2-dehydro-3-deoxy-6-phosphogalactonate aldolase n=1 Tax=Hyphomonas sp. FCG-A18 TaxID=3080019 RepID=UPI002B2BC03A|nr:2-dehydro-3-deoxy-6-phosphogalactonate aldolase [Hyphomonas sp. FCG-A18]
MSTREAVREALATCPIVAILRGIRPNEAEAIGQALYEVGIRIMEVPLNSPSPLESIAILANTLNGRAIIGAGTVLTAEEVDAVADAGGQIIVSPNTDPAVIRQSLARGLEPMPGVFTASEAFTAIKAGATTLKLFPADTGGPAHLKALKAVLPETINVLAVGGVNPQTYSDWITAGASGAGCGSTLYKPGDTPAQTAEKARAMVAAISAG